MTGQGAGEPRRPWRERRVGIVLAVALDALLAASLVATDSGALLRAAAVFAFFLLGPGLAVTGFLRLRDPGTEFAIAIPLSLALNTGVAGGMTVAGEWRPDTALLVSALVTVPVLALQVRSDVRVRAAFGRSPAWRASGPMPLWQPALPPDPPVTAPPAPRTGVPAELPLDGRAAKLPLVPAADGPATAARNRTGRAGGDIDEATVPIARPPVNGQAVVAASTGIRGRQPDRSPGWSSPELVGNRIVSLARPEIEADRVALLVPNGGVWTVVAGANLSAEQRAIRLTPEHRMIREVVVGERPLLWDATGRRSPDLDGLASDLDGLALPPSEHLLAMPLAGARSLIILARPDSPFLEEELQLLTRVLTPQALFLKIALEIREFGQELDHVFDDGE